MFVPPQETCTDKDSGCQQDVRTEAVVMHFNNQTPFLPDKGSRNSATLCLAIQIPNLELQDNTPP